MRLKILWFCVLVAHVPLYAIFVEEWWLAWGHLTYPYLFWIAMGLCTSLIYESHCLLKTIKSRILVSVLLFITGSGISALGIFIVLAIGDYYLYIPLIVISLVEVLAGLLILWSTSAVIGAMFPDNGEQATTHSER